MSGTMKKRCIVGSWAVEFRVRRQGPQQRRRRQRLQQVAAAEAITRTMQTMAASRLLLAR